MSEIGDLDTLLQLKNLTWDGNLISKGARDRLFDRGLIVKSDGYQGIRLYLKKASNIYMI